MPRYVSITGRSQKALRTANLITCMHALTDQNQRRSRVVGAPSSSESVKHALSVEKCGVSAAIASFCLSEYACASVRCFTYATFSE